MVASTGGWREMLQQKNRGEKEKLRDLLSSSSDRLPREPSFRVYYSVAAGAVPFEWELQPGTPKTPPAGVLPADPPPLTPPPSHLHTPNPPHPPRSKKNLIAAVLPRLRWPSRQRQKKSPAATLTCSSSVSSSSSSTPTTPGKWTASTRSGRTTRRSWGSSSSATLSADEQDVHDTDADDSPTSVMCFRVGSVRISSLKKSLIPNTPTPTPTLEGRSSSA